MTHKKKYSTLDSILKFLKSKSIEGESVWYLDKIDFLKDFDLKDLIEFQSILVKDLLVQSSTLSINKTFPMNITLSGIKFISDGGYESIKRKEKTEKLKSKIILISVLFSIVVGIISSTLSILNYNNSNKDQNKKIEALQKEININKLEIENLKSKK